jgi:hypothetical protein
MLYVKFDGEKQYESDAGSEDTPAKTFNPPEIRLVNGFRPEIDEHRKPKAGSRFSDEVTHSQSELRTIFYVSGTPRTRGVVVYPTDFEGIAMVADIPFDAVEKLVEQCLASGKILDLTKANEPQIQAFVRDHEAAKERQQSPSNTP